MKITIKREHRHSTGILWYIFIAIYLSDSLIVATNVNTNFDSLAKVLFAASAVILLIQYITVKNTLISKRVIFLLITSLALIASMLYNNSDIITYLYKFLILLYAYLLSEKYSIKEFYSSYRSLMKVFMIASLTLYLLKIVNVDISFLPSIYNTKGIHYNTIFIANIFNEYDGIMRAQSFFWEAGVYAAYLCIALTLELFSNKKLDYKYITLIMVSIFTTLSTTGLIVSIIVIIAYILSTGISTLRNKFYIIGLTLFGILVLAMDNDMVIQVFGKISGSRSTFVNRWNSITGNINMISESPFLGIGPTRSRIELTEYFYSIGETRSINNLNTILANYSVFGLLPFLYYIYYLIRYCSGADKNKFTNILILIALVLLLSSTGFHFSAFFTIIFMYRLKDLRMENSTNKVEEA